MKIIATLFKMLTKAPPAVLTDFKKYTDLVYKIIGAAMKVHSEMNWGLLVSKGLVQDDPSFQSGSDVPVPLTLVIMLLRVQSRQVC